MKEIVATTLIVGTIGFLIYLFVITIADRYPNGELTSTVRNKERILKLEKEVERLEEKLNSFEMDKE